MMCLQKKDLAKKIKLGKRILLKEIGTPKTFMGNSQSWEINNLKEKLNLSIPLPPKIYVIEANENAWDNPLLNRMSCGAGFFKSATAATEKMIRHFMPLFNKILSAGKIIHHFTIPNGGRPMNLDWHIANSSKSRSFHPVISVSNMKISRIYNHRNQRFEADLETYQGPKEIQGYLYTVADTAIASGSTAENCLEIAFHGNKKFGINGSIPESGIILFFTICGCFQGISRAFKYALKEGIKPEKFIPIFYNTIFDVTDNNNILDFLEGQTDLPIFNPLTITNQYILDNAARIYNYLPICSVGDTGNRVKNPSLYLLETLLEILIIKERPEKFKDKMINLDEPEWSRMKKLLKNTKLVDYAWKFYEIQMNNLNYRKFGKKNPSISDDFLKEEKLKIFKIINSILDQPDLSLSSIQDEIML